MTPRGPDPKLAGFFEAPMDLVKTFGPMAGMHAAMDRLGVGMPCGLIARFQGRTASDLGGAIEIARRRFPVLERHVAWVGTRPMLVTCPASQNQNRVPENLSLFKSDSEGPLWRYQVVRDGRDSWLRAVWLHAAADGPSMLRLLETIVAAIADRPVPQFQSQSRRPFRHRPMPGWLVRFLIEQNLRYIRVAPDRPHSPGVAWTIVPSDRSAPLLERAQIECGSPAAWFAGGASIAFSEQQNVPAGRVMLNLPIQRDSMEPVGGFGFGAGSLLLPVRLNGRSSLQSVASRIFKRLEEMIDQGWDKNFERLLSNNPRRHLRIATIHARGLSTPIVSVSWKGARWQLGREDGTRDVACFAASQVAHISGHVDRNGLSVSVTSCQSDAAREDLLRRIVDRLGGGSVSQVLRYSLAHTLEGVENASHAIQSTLA